MPGNIAALGRTDALIMGYVLPSAAGRILLLAIRGVAQFGRARGLGPRGRRFKSCRPDLLEMFHVYVLRSQTTGRFYVGSTGNLQDRLHRHNSGQSKATRHGVPWTLIYCEPHPSRSAATKREMYFKTGKGRDEIQRLPQVQLSLD